MPKQAIGRVTSSFKLPVSFAVRLAWTPLRCRDTIRSPVSGESIYPKEFNHVVGIDSLEIRGSQGNRYTAVNVVDLGTSFQQVVLVKV